MYRNTPLRDGGRSPAQLALGRHLRDGIPSPPQRYKLSPEWYQDLRRRELSMVTHGAKSKAAYDEGTKLLSWATVSSARMPEPRFLQIRLGSESCDQISASPNRPKRAKSRGKTAGSLFTRAYTLVKFSQTKRCFFSFL